MSNTKPGVFSGFIRARPKTMNLDQKRRHAVASYKAEAAKFKPGKKSKDVSTEDLENLQEESSHTDLLDSDLDAA